MPPDRQPAAVTPTQNGRRPDTVRRVVNRNRSETSSTTPRTPAAVRGNKTLRANITIASLNINGAGTSQTRDKWQHIDQLRETAIESLHSQFHQRLHIINSSVPEHPNAMGVALVVNKSCVAWQEILKYELVPGRAIFASIPWHKESVINVLAVYAPNRESDNADFWKLLRQKWLPNEFPKPDVVLGDFNCVEADIDRLPVNQNAPAAARALEEFKAEIGLMDGWRQENPDKVAYSWSDTSGRNSRHSLVSVNFSNPGAPYIGRGRWSVPLFLLQDRNVMRKIRERKY